MYKIFLAALMTAGLLSCGSNEEKPVIIPSHVLPVEKMSVVIADLHVAEAEASLQAPTAATNTPDSAVRSHIDFEQVFKTNQISKQQYDSSLAFYSRHPALLDSVYNLVISRLDKMKGEAAQ